MLDGRRLSLSLGGFFIDAWFVLDPVDPMSVWLSSTSHCVRTGIGTMRTDEYRYPRTGSVLVLCVPVWYRSGTTSIV